jgi:transcriptional regulator with XRE-family HTH domain/quercetin dioxygenase-like cupin family protein
MSTMPSRAEDRGKTENELGSRLRAARAKRGLALRELARRLGISASALSQIETGKSRPSVQTLYAIVSELEISLDSLFGEVPDVPESIDPVTPRQPKTGGEANGGQGSLASRVQRVGDRAALHLNSGVKWERLTRYHDPSVDFLRMVYEVGGASSADNKLVRHNGREYGIVNEGELEVTVGFETYLLRPGDSISFDSNEPHMLRNPGDVPAEATWFVIGRRQSDPRSPLFGESDSP